jgi:hypothetical protein
MRVSHLATTDQNILLGASRFTTAKHMNATHDGGSRVRTVTSDRDAALPSLKSVRLLSAGTRSRQPL